MNFINKSIMAILMLSISSQIAFASEQIEPKKAYEMVQKNKNVVIIDVREGSEYDESSIPGAILIQKDKLVKNFNQYESVIGGKTIIVHCKAGIRGNETANAISKLTNKSVYNLKGGIKAWKKAELPTIDGKMSITRQVHIMVGALILIFGGLAFHLNKKYLIGNMIIGFGLLFAGATGFCGMAQLIKLMPWN